MKILIIYTYIHKQIEKNETRRKSKEVEVASCNHGKCDMILQGIEAELQSQESVQLHKSAYTEEILHYKRNPGC